MKRITNRGCLWPLMMMALSVSLLLTGCSADKNAGQAEIVLSSGDHFDVVSWQSDDSHRSMVTGKVLLDGQPVLHAGIQISGSRTIETDGDGAFSLTVDRSRIASIPLRIGSLEKAETRGGMLTRKEKEELKSVSRLITISYPIQIERVAAHPNQDGLVDVYAKADAGPGNIFPAMRIDQYSIYGSVRDANGKPVPDAVVSISRDGVEGFAKSKPSSPSGEYRLYYLPEADEALNLHVFANGRHYRLPDNKIYRFPEGTSVETDIILPDKGNIIKDERPYLKSRTAPGALYKGVLIGLSVDSAADYTVTIPENDGSFMLTLPEDIWKQKPSFFETESAEFHKEPLAAGNPIPSAALKRPDPDEPSRIRAEMKQKPHL